MKKFMKLTYNWSLMMPIAVVVGIITLFVCVVTNLYKNTETAWSNTIATYKAYSFKI